MWKYRERMIQGVIRMEVVGSTSIDWLIVLLSPKQEIAPEGLARGRTIVTAS